MFGSQTRRCRLLRVSPALTWLQQRNPADSWFFRSERCAVHINHTRIEDDCTLGAVGLLAQWRASINYQCGSAGLDLVLPTY